jgi:hypothetical protein
VGEIEREAAREERVGERCDGLRLMCVFAEQRDALRCWLDLTN